MPRGDKSKYTDKQKRKAEHIEEGYESRGVFASRSRTTGLGHGQQGERWRQEERLGSRQARQQSIIPQGRQIGR